MPQAIENRMTLSNCHFSDGRPNRARDTKPSPVWKTVKRAWVMPFAPIFTRFGRILYATGFGPFPAMPGWARRWPDTARGIKLDTKRAGLHRLALQAGPFYRVLAPLAVRLDRAALVAEEHDPYGWPAQVCNVKADTQKSPVAGNLAPSFALASGAVGILQRGGQRATRP